MKKRRYAPFGAVVMVSLISVLGFVTADTSQPNPNPAYNQPSSSSRVAPLKTATVSKIFQAANSSQLLDTLSLEVARRDHTATTLADGKVIIIGGEGQNGPVGEVEVLDPAARIISVASHLITARANHSATLLPDGRVLVAGGSNTRGALKSTEIFDPNTNSFTSGPNLRRSRKGHTATLLEEGGILIAGGNEDRTAEILDLSQQRSKLLGTTMTNQRAFHSAIRLQKGKVLLVGGIGYYNGDTAELFDPKDQSFSAARNWLNVNRVRPSLRMLPDGKIQIIGGDEKGTMELFNPGASSIRDYVDLTTTSDIVSSRQMLSGQTRTAFIDAALKQKQNEESNLMHSPNVSVKAAGGDVQNSAYGAIARANYAYAEVTQKNLAVIAGGVDSKGQFLRSVILLDSSSATVTTDNVEYDQQARPVLKGAGWMPNEEVLIVRQKVETGNRVTLRGIADSHGAFTSGELSAEGNQLGVYILTAVGQSSNHIAQTAYRIAGAFNPQTKTPYDKPFRVKALIPVGAESGTIQTELGPMNWKATPMGNMKFISANKAKAKKGGELSAQASITYPLYSFELPWSNVSFPIPATPLSIENSSGLFTGDISIELKAVFDPGCLLCGECCCCDIGFGEVCVPCPILPSASADAYILGSFDLHTVNDIVFQGTFVKNNILLFPFIGIEVSIPETPFKVSATAGLYAGINLSSDRPVKVRPTIDFKNLTVKSGIGIGFEFVPPDFHFGPFNKITPPDSIDGDFEVLDFGDLCAKLSVGPGLSAAFSFGDIGICTPSVSATARIAAFVKGCVTPVKDTATCEVFDVDISVGAQLDFQADINCGVVSKVGSPGTELEFAL